MSELGNAIKNLRGDRSQEAIANACGLNIRTVQRAEAGKDVRLATLRTLAKHFKLSRADWAALLIFWLRLELGDDFKLLEIRSKARGKVRLNTDIDELLEIYRSIPANLQNELLRATRSEDILRVMAPLNALYDSLKKAGRTI